MNYCKGSQVFPHKKFIQFNDLVFGNYEFISSSDISGGFKTTTQEFSFGHGSYTNAKQKQQFSTEQQLSLTLNFRYAGIPRDDRKFFKDYIYKELVKVGKLWALENGRIIWTYAFVDSFSEPFPEGPNTLSMDVSFNLYEGIWHYADEKKTFLKPFDLCDFMDCLDFEEEEHCSDCCLSCMKKNVIKDSCTKCACECEFLNIEDSLCYLYESLDDNFYRHCSGGYQIIHNCTKGEKLWGHEAMLGHKICKDSLCDNHVAGTFYSSTVLETDNVEISIIGEVEDPRIELNGNVMEVKGKFNGELLIKSNGDVLYKEEDCCEFEKLPVDALKLVKCNTFGWNVKHGRNKVYVETGECCSPVCVYIKEDKMTY